MAVLEILSSALPGLVNIERAVQDDSSGREGLRKFRVVVWYELCGTTQLVCGTSYLTSNYAALAALCLSFPFSRIHLPVPNLSIVKPSCLIVDSVLSILPANHLTVFTEYIPPLNKIPEAKPVVFCQTILLFRGVHPF